MALSRQFSAVLLSAGRSIRMGRDKALLEVDGVPLWRRQRDLLARAGAAEIFLSARPEQEWTRGVTGVAALLHDAFPNCGPIGGVTAGLERASHPHVAILAVDLPGMIPDWFDLLLGGCAAGVGVVGRRGEFFEPLAAVYPRELMPLAWEALARADYSLQHLVVAAIGRGFMRSREISAAETPWFRNLNEPGANVT